MAHSVEGRFPFLDHRVVEFANQLPPVAQAQRAHREVPAEGGQPRVAAGRDQRPAQAALPGADPSGLLQRLPAGLRRGAALQFRHRAVRLLQSERGGPARRQAQAGPPAGRDGRHGPGGHHLDPAGGPAVHIQFQTIPPSRRHRRREGRRREAVIRKGAAVPMNRERSSHRRRGRDGPHRAVAEGEHARPSPERRRAGHQRRDRLLRVPGPVRQGVRPRARGAAPAARQGFGPGVGGPGARRWPPTTVSPPSWRPSRRPWTGSAATRAVTRPSPACSPSTTPRPATRRRSSCRPTLLDGGTLNVFSLTIVTPDGEEKSARLESGGVRPDRGGVQLQAAQPHDHALLPRGAPELRRRRDSQQERARPGVLRQVRRRGLRPRARSRISTRPRSTSWPATWTFPRPSRRAPPRPTPTAPRPPRRSSSSASPTRPWTCSGTPRRTRSRWKRPRSRWTCPPTRCATPSPTSPGRAGRSLPARGSPGHGRPRGSGSRGGLRSARRNAHIACPAARYVAAPRASLTAAESRICAATSRIMSSKERVGVKPIRSRKRDRSGCREPRSSKPAPYASS